MITSTFSHIQGIGPEKEVELWAAGLLTWEDFHKAPPANLSSTRIAFIDQALAESLLNLDNPSYFAKLLPASQHWRLFRRYRPVTAYLDIETTGLGYGCEITSISLYDGDRISYFIQGDNLDDFPDALEAAGVIVTYNGKSFDIPVIESYFGIEVRKPHIDLRYILGSLGIKGGLKNCEKQLGLERAELAGFDGSLAVVLWNIYQATGKKSALETLLAYNIMDTINLEILLIEAYNRHLQNTPFLQERLIPGAAPVSVPFTADLDLLYEIKASLPRDSLF